MRRRTLLQAAGAGLVVSFATGCALPVIPKRPSPQPRDALSWVRFADGRYELFLPRVEMGQHIATALKQVACDELGVPWSALDVRLHGTADIRPVRATVGSDSVKDFALPLAQACATLRDALAAGRSAGQLDAQPRPLSELRAFGAQAQYVGRRVPLEQGAALVSGQPLFAADQRPARHALRPRAACAGVARAGVRPAVGR